MTTASTVGLLTVDWLLVAPVLAPAIGVLVVLLLDALTPQRWLLGQIAGVAAAAAGFAAALVIGSRAVLDEQGFSKPQMTVCTPAPGGACYVNVSGPAVGIAAVALLAAAIVLLLMWPARRDDAGSGAVPTSLVLAATAGTAAVATGQDIATWLIGLELATVPLVALVAMHSGRRAAAGGLSYLTTSVLSFGLLAVAVALWVVATGHIAFDQQAAASAWGNDARRPLLLASLLLAIAGLGFKTALVPFHQWVPPAYGGSNTAVVAALASISKLGAIAGFIAIMRPLVALRTDGIQPHSVSFVIGVLAVATMTVGGLVALRQNDMVRFIAWSGIAQGGWLILPLASMARSGLSAMAAYGIAYALATLVAMGVVEAISGSDSQRRDLTAYRGLFRREPLLAFALAMALLSLAGLPPGVLGLVAKVVALQPIIGAELWPLGLVAVANIVLGLAFYLRVLGVMFVTAPPDSEPVRLRGSRTAALTIATTLLVGLSVAPQVVLTLVR